MKTRISTLLSRCVPLAVLLVTGASAQVPVDDDGNVIGNYETADAKALQDAEALGNEGIPLLSQAELEELVGPVALYPDDLLAVVLPASTYPLQVVQAARFLEDLEDDPSLKPNPEWDDSIIALVNYPEVVELLNDDLDWTWRLGEAVVAQQADVVNAVENFRDRAYAAGNLKSDGYQNVARNEGVIEITPVNEDIIYVPYYEPERVVYYQPRPVYYYYPRPCPVYYYPYPSGYAFSRPYFWGVTTAFTIGWTSNHLRVFHHSYHGHPYYGRHYYDRWWYRRPDIHVYNNVYIRNNVNVTVNRYVDGDYWRPSRETRLRARDQRITRNTYYRDQGGSSGSTTINRYVNNSRDARDERRVVTTRSGTTRQADRNRLTSQEQMRRTINEVQRERRTESRDGVNRNQRQSTTRREATTERQSQDRQTTTRQDRQTTRQDTGPRVTQQQIARQFADQREARDRQPSERRSTPRQTSERGTVQRQSSERQAADRYTARRQIVPQQRETTDHRATTRRQATERRATTQRQATERRATTQRQTTQRQTTQRQTTQRQTTQRQSSQSSENARTESSSRSRSNRERRERR